MPYAKSAASSPSIPKPFTTTSRKLRSVVLNKLAAVDARFVQLCDSTPLAATIAPLQPNKNGVWLATGDANFGYVLQLSGLLGR